ncbi:hypothetical protein [Methylobacterium tarhaniae]|nr:hypothetical protein [Methylobacterium tarhaniae]
MPDHVPDASSEILLNDLKALYAKQDRFVLIMTGAELPQNSPRFMADYLAWSRETVALQSRFCAGAVRVEPGPERRRTYEKQASALNQSGKSPYPYSVAASLEAALLTAAEWLKINA